MKELTFTVHGKVQGVWFRAWTRDTARELGVTGWVRNTSGGDVEGVAHGDDQQLDTFLERLHDGPPLARVTSVDANKGDTDTLFSGFEVRR